LTEHLWSGDQDANYHAADEIKISHELTPNEDFDSNELRELRLRMRMFER
jgi:hypothetical protein